MKDVEILLRGFAILINEKSYRPSMVKFLSSLKAMSFDETKLKQLDYLLESFLNSCQDLPSDAFHSIQGRFSPMIFESVFVAICEKSYAANSAVKGKINCESMQIFTLLRAKPQVPT